MKRHLAVLALAIAAGPAGLTCAARPAEDEEGRSASGSDGAPSDPPVGSGSKPEASDGRAPPPPDASPADPECVPRYVYEGEGSPCATAGDCPKDWPISGFCVDTPQGGRCYPGHECNPCNSHRECEPIDYWLSCFQGRCRPRGHHGDPCVSSWDCDDLEDPILYCHVPKGASEGTCYDGRPGDPCDRSGQCGDGLGSCRDGVCEAWDKGEGEAG